MESFCEAADFYKQITCSQLVLMDTGAYWNSCHPMAYESFQRWCWASNILNKWGEQTFLASASSGVWSCYMYYLDYYCF